MKPPILITMLLLLASLACTLTNNLTVTHPAVTETATQETTATTALEDTAIKPEAPAQDTILAPNAEPTGAPIVCFTNNYDGLVRVRECPGVDCREIAILPAGTVLGLIETVTGEAGGSWAQINAPIQGWLNARYICQP